MPMRLPFFFAGMGGKQIDDFAPMVGGSSLQAADGDGLAVFEAAAAAGRLAGAIACASQNRGEHIRFAIEHVGVGETPLRDQADIFGDIRVGRARPLAVDNFMVISWIVRIGAVQNECFLLSQPTWDDVPPFIVAIM